MPSKNLPPKPRSIAAKKTVSIIASLYNEDLVDSLLNSAIQELRSLLPGITVNVYRVPGAFEIPVCAKKLIQTNTIDVIIALGVIIKGETSHADLVGNSVTQSLQEIAIDFNTPIIHEVLLTENRAQAEERCSGQKNRGTEAAKAAVTMSELFANLDIASKRTSNFS